MCFARIAAVAAAALILWCMTASAGGPLRPFKHGFWSGGAYTDDGTGAFTHCSAGVAYDSGINLFVLVTEGYRWWLGLINPIWELTPNAKSPIKLRLDAGPLIDAVASIPGRQLMLVSLPDSSKLLAAFRRSSRLALDAEGQSFSFKLNDTPVVMDQLANCVRMSVALGTPVQPTTAETKIAPAGAAALSAVPPRPMAIAGSGSLPKAAEAVPSPPTARPQTDEALGPVPSADGTAAKPQASPTGTTTVMAKLPQRPRPQTASEPPVLAAAQSSEASSSAVSNSGASAAAMPDALSEGATAARSGSTASGTEASLAATTKTAPPPPTVATANFEAEHDLDRASGAPTASLSSAPAHTAPPAAENPPAMPSPRLAPSPAPPLTLTSFAPMTSTAPSSATAPEVSPATATAVEEVRLATDFLSKAGLQNGRLVTSDKPPALADFGAVWRSEDAAGAVKIIPARPEISGIAIASNLIAVDPQLCKGDFSAARFRTDIDNSVVFSAVLSCNEASEQRVTEYFIARRHQGGFVVFAVIRSNVAGETLNFDWQKINVLSKAAVQAVESQG
jgi:hypothetical protein